MHKSRQFLLHFVLLALSLAITNPSRAQSTDATLSGTVTDASAAAIPGAKISVKNLNTGQSTDSQTDAAGSFTLPKLTPGDYEVSVTAVGLAPQVVKVTLAAGAAQTLTLALTATQAQPQTPAANLPNAPSCSKIEPSLSDLASLRNRHKATPGSRPSSTSALTCSRFTRSSA